MDRGCPGVRCLITDEGRFKYCPLSTLSTEISLAGIRFNNRELSAGGLGAGTNDCDTTGTTVVLDSTVDCRGRACLVGGVDKAVAFTARGPIRGIELAGLGSIIGARFSCGGAGIEAGCS